MKSRNDFASYSKLLFVLLIPVVIAIYFFQKFKSKNIVVDREEYDFVPDEDVHGLNTRQMQVLDYMKRNGSEGRVSEMVKEFSETDRTLRRDLNKLEKMGLVKRSGSTKSVSYTLS